MRNDIKVGLFFIIALVILLGIFEFVGEIPFLKKQYSLITYFESVGELKVGNPVKLNGVEVGKVAKIRIADNRIMVNMKVKKGVTLKKDSIASIKLTSLLGTSYINLSFGTPKSPAASPGTVLQSKEPPDINEILSKVETTVGSLESAFSAFDAFGENKEQISKLITNFGLVMEDLTKGKGTIGMLLKDDTLYNEAKGALANINEISGSLKEGRGTLGKLITDESLYNETKVAMSGLAKLGDRISSSEGTIGKLLNDDKLYNEATEAATNLNSILKKINEGEGTLGRLVNQDDLYFDAKNAIQKVEKGISTAEDLAPLATLGTIFGIITIF